MACDGSIINGKSLKKGEPLLMLHLLPCVTAEGGKGDGVVIDDPTSFYQRVSDESSMDFARRIFR